LVISGQRNINRFVKLFAVFMSLYHLYCAAVGGTDPLFFRFTHVAMALFLAFLSAFSSSSGLRRAGDGFMAAVAVLLYCYFYFNFDRFVTYVPFMDTPARWDTVLGLVLILLVLEATRRYIGPSLSLIALVFLLYALTGPVLPGIWQHRGLSVVDVIHYVSFTLNGILGSAVAVSSGYLVLFIIFGSFISITGAGEYFTLLAVALAGKTRGGPGKVAVLTSAFIGSIIGSAAANVSTTGVFTIPLMKKTGFKPDFAAGVEAAASTGGGMLPPIMGASAFLMAELLGIPYLEVAKASLLPALLYFMSVLVMVDIEATKNGLQGLAGGQRLSTAEVLKQSGNLLSLVVVVYSLLTGYTPSFAALAGIVTSCLWGAVKTKDRLSPGLVLAGLEKAAVTGLQIILACAAAGIIIGSVSLTGLSGKVTSIMLMHVRDYQLLILFIIMISTVILGMGMPISPTYIMASVLGAPALIALGFEPVAAHLFILCFAALAPLTPPVALASYAAAGIAGSSFVRTSRHAIFLASCGFVIPYIFIYNNELLLMGRLPEIFLAVATASVGVVCFAAGIQGFFLVRLGAVKRIISLSAGIIMIIPGWSGDLAGILALVFLAVSTREQKKRSLPRFIHQESVQEERK
jgi:TRAP transporter 4TM/12TM fusion protein